MRNIIGRLAGAVLALALGSGLAAAQSKVTIAVGGSACLCYLPTVLARQLGEYERAGVAVELVDLMLDDDVIVARVEKAGVSFTVDDAVIERLSDARASAAVLAAVRKAIDQFRFVMD